MREIKLSVGIIYVEEFDNRSEEDRIKIFDSEQRYLDYFSIEYLKQQAYFDNRSISEQFQYYLDCLKHDFFIENVLDSLEIGYEIVTTDWTEIADKLEEITGEKYNTVEKVLDNEWINKIGKNYILVCED